MPTVRSQNFHEPLPKPIDISYLSASTFVPGRVLYLMVVFTKSNLVTLHALTLSTSWLVRDVDCSVRQPTQSRYGVRKVDHLNHK
ncbi:hypothetical protein FPOAC1_000687 [Fusarium poae]|uniref:hypothetical protein n=1 Tax=Fusarium poae TaxID=36050 RepID=UPI001CE9595F|nr:hypothetical protein FPOAC1_000687 [Fusarium poae]KAG8674715.1 hypothetical protein FPOAC1_000687 [Fusarium poae]